MNEKNIKDISIKKEMEKSFLDYAMSVIISRAIPDIRDGLKPVHRRILFAMNELNITPSSQFKKSARIVGEVIGKYHPHGDSAVYETMVRMAQEFSYRYPLIEGQGNFGSIDGDGAAAMRYTEARLHKISSDMLKDIKKNTINFNDNYDATEREPEVLPSIVPNILINGGSGIAVGMATNIPPHNINEIIDSAIFLLKNQQMKKKLIKSEILNIIKGPDFPTAGILMGRKGIKEYLETGQGSIILRGKAFVDENTENRIIITEIPYQVNKTKLIEKIAELTRFDKKTKITPILDGIKNIRDESTEEIRIVIDVKKNYSAHAILNRMYKYTQLQTSLGVNLLALDNNQPLVLDVVSILEKYLIHQDNVLIRKTKFNLKKAQEKKEILDGFIIAITNIDEVIKIIKSSKNTEDANNKLIKEFSLTSNQSKSILNMRLQRLTALAIEELKEELEELIKKIKIYNELLENKNKRDENIIERLEDLKTNYGDERRTIISDQEINIDDEDLIPEEDIFIALTKEGYIKRISFKEYKVQNRGGFGKRALKLNEDDYLIKNLKTSTHKEIMFFSNFGKVYRIKGYKIPEFSANSKGIPIINLLSSLNEEEKIVEILEYDFNEDAYLIFATQKGLVKKTKISEYSRINTNGKRAINLKEDDNLISVINVNKKGNIFISTRNGMSIKFDHDQIRNSGRVSSGVKGISLRVGDVVNSMFFIEDENTEILVITENGIGKRTDESYYRSQNRAGKGLKALNINKKTGLLSKSLPVTKDDELAIITNNGNLMLTKVEQIAKSKRNTQGVKIINIKENQKVTSINKIND